MVWTVNSTLVIFAMSLVFAVKKVGFIQSIRAMNPGLIVTDELADKEDAKCLIDAMNCGVKVIATAHASSMEELRRKDFLLIYLLIILKDMFYFQKERVRALMREHTTKNSQK